MARRNVTRDKVKALMSSGLKAKEIASELSLSVIHIRQVMACIKNPELDKRYREYANSYSKQYREDGRITTSREKMREYQREYYKRNKEAISLELAERGEKDRRDCFEAYGNCCACCGIDDPKFLTIDHINNDGNVDRFKNGTGCKLSGTKLYAYLRSLGYPKDRYQLLCWNCNCARAKNGGVCPHEEWQQWAEDICGPM